MGKDKNKDDPLKKEREAIRKTENQINKGSFSCGCGANFGSQLLLDLHMVSCDD